MGLIVKGLADVDNAENILKIKNLVALFVQAMDVSKAIEAFCYEMDELLTCAELGLHCIGV